MASGGASNNGESSHIPGSEAAFYGSLAQAATDGDSLSASDSSSSSSQSHSTSSSAAAAADADADARSEPPSSLLLPPVSIHRRRSCSDVSHNQLLSGSSDQSLTSANLDLHNEQQNRLRLPRSSSDSYHPGLHSSPKQQLQQERESLLVAVDGDDDRNDAPGPNLNPSIDPSLYLSPTREGGGPVWKIVSTAKETTATTPPKDITTTNTTTNTTTTKNNFVINNLTTTTTTNVPHSVYNTDPSRRPTLSLHKHPPTLHNPLPDLHNPTRPAADSPQPPPPRPYPNQQQWEQRQDGELHYQFGRQQEDLEHHNSRYHHYHHHHHHQQEGGSSSRRHKQQKDLERRPVRQQEQHQKHHDDDDEEQDLVQDQYKWRHWFLQSTGSFPKKMVRMIAPKGRGDLPLERLSSDRAYNLSVEPRTRKRDDDDDGEDDEGEDEEGEWGGGGERRDGDWDEGVEGEEEQDLVVGGRRGEGEDEDEGEDGPVGLGLRLDEDDPVGRALASLKPPPRKRQRLGH